MLGENLSGPLMQFIKLSFHGFKLCLALCNFSIIMPFWRDLFFKVQYPECEKQTTDNGNIPTQFKAHKQTVLD